MSTIRNREFELYTGKPCKQLTCGQTKSGGRNNTGRITSRRKGGGAKRLLRDVDRDRRKYWGLEGKLLRFEYDPGRSARIALIKYPNEMYRYVIAAKGMKIGQTIIAKDKADPSVKGNEMRLKDIPQGVLIHNVELYPNCGGKIAKSAGCYAKILGRDGDLISLKMRSGEVRKVSQECIASIGEVGNADHSNRVIGKAGNARHLGRKPLTRAVAKNPVDHKMGGRTKGKQGTSESGKVRRGLKTRDLNKPYSNFIISRRVNHA